MTLPRQQTCFPRHGKFPCDFSTPWKKVFHTVENPGYLFRTMKNNASRFPRCGKKFSTLWKIAVLFSLGAMAAAASPFGVSAERAAHDGRPALRVAFEIPADHHLYSSFTVVTPDGDALAPLAVPEPDTFKPGDFEASYSASFAALYAPPAAESIVVTYQGCKGELCFLPEEVTLAIGPAADTAAPAAPDSGPVPSAAPAAGLNPAPEATPWPELLAARGEPARLVGYADAPAFLAFLDSSSAPAEAQPGSSAWALFLDDPGEFYLRHGVLPSILLILIGGFLLNLTPCVLPMIPINLAIIGASGTDSPRHVRFGLGLVYGLGMALVYGALGLVVVLSGSVFGAINSSPVFNAGIAALFFVLALAMFDVWQIDFSRFRRPGGLAGRARLPAVLVLGGISALLAGACVAPVLIAVLALAGSLYAQGVGMALALPFLLGVGMALPWPLAAAGLAVLPKPGAWMEKVKKAFGVFILLLAAYYAWNAYRALRPAALPVDTAETVSGGSVFRNIDLAQAAPGDFEALVREALTSGKPILFDFGAHWCKVCKVMQATTLQDPEVVARLEDVFPIHVIADVPNKPPVKDLLAPFAVQGYPTYLLYPAR